MKKLENKIALVTGASRGIGAAVAKRFAAEGAHVILTARTVGGLEEVDDAIQAAGGTATIAPLDLRDHALIDALGATIFQRWGKLDILVSNAAVLGNLTPVGHMYPKVWDEILSVNLTANYRLIRSLDPLLRAAEAARAIFVTSGASQMATPYWGAYAASKAGLETLVQTYANEVANTRIGVHVLDPGTVRTAMRAAAFPGENPDTLPAPDAITDRFLALATAAKNQRSAA